MVIYTVLSWCNLHRKFTLFCRDGFLSQIYALLSVKFSGLKTCECKKNDQFKVCWGEAWAQLQYLAQSLQSFHPHRHRHPEARWNREERVVSRLCDVISTPCEDPEMILQDFIGTSFCTRESSWCCLQPKICRYILLLHKPRASLQTVWRC